MLRRQNSMTEKLDHKRRSKINFAFNVFQVRFIVAVLSLSLFVSAFLGYKMYSIEKEKSQILQIQNESVTQIVRQFDQGLFLFVLMIIVLQLMALTFLIAHLTQKVSGPINRIQSELEEAIKTGNPADLRPVRKSDDFQDFFRVLREYIDTFKSGL